MGANIEDGRRRRQVVGDTLESSGTGGKDGRERSSGIVVKRSGLVVKRRGHDWGGVGVTASPAAPAQKADADAAQIDSNAAQEQPSFPSPPTATTSSPVSGGKIHRPQSERWENAQSRCCPRDLKETTHRCAEHAPVVTVIRVAVVDVCHGMMNMDDMLLTDAPKMVPRWSGHEWLL